MNHRRPSNILDVAVVSFHCELSLLRKDRSYKTTTETKITVHYVKQDLSTWALRSRRLTLESIDHTLAEAS